MKSLKLLIKFPTRSRPEKFFEVLDAYYTLMITNNFEFIVSCDIDDNTMNNDTIKNRLNNYPNLKYYFSNNKSKIEAINNNLQNVEFDVLLLASDDMVPIVYGYDAYIINTFKNKLNYNTDYVLWFNDGFQGNNLNTLSIIGKKFYDRFGYIYNPEYKSLFCDLEFTQVLRKTGRFIYFDDIVIKHKQYSIINEEPDNLYIENNKFYDYDLQIFNKRQSLNFNL